MDSDPDLGDPKTCGSCRSGSGFGSATLLFTTGTKDYLLFMYIFFVVYWWLSALGVHYYTVWRTYLRTVYPNRYCSAKSPPRPHPRFEPWIYLTAVRRVKLTNELRHTQHEIIKTRPIIPMQKNKTILIWLGCPFKNTDSFWAGIFKKSMGLRHRGGIGFSYRPARLHRLAEFIPWNQCRGPINI